MNVVEIFEKSGALLKGHFLLSSGLHSGEYLQCALVLQHPEYAAKLGNALADKFRDKSISCVAGPALGGIIIAHEVARALNVKCIFGERQNGKMTLRRGFEVGPKDKVLIVEDVVTTGKSIKELIEVVKSKGAKIVGIGAIIDRSSSKSSLDNLKALTEINIKTFEKNACPLCKANQPLIKPGSR